MLSETRVAATNMYSRQYSLYEFDVLKAWDYARTDSSYPKADTGTKASEPKNNLFCKVAKNCAKRCASVRLSLSYWMSQQTAVFGRISFCRTLTAC